MPGRRIRWEGATRPALVVLGAIALIVVVPKLVGPGEPPRLPPDVGVMPEPVPPPPPAPAGQVPSTAEPAASANRVPKVRRAARRRAAEERGPARKRRANKRQANKRREEDPFPAATRGRSPAPPVTFAPAPPPPSSDSFGFEE